jgi:cytochrome c553
MKTTRNILVAVSGAIALAASTFAQGANPQAGAAKAKEVCAACHGMDGNSPTPDYPRLGGQPSDYLAHSLRAYKDGRRKNPIMSGFASALTEQDIQNLAAYYASQPAAVYVERMGTRVK